MEETKVREDSDSGVTEEGEISDYDESYAREISQQQQGPSDVEARTPDRSGSESKRMRDENTQGRHELVQSSEYPIRPGEENCQFFLRTGKCGYGSDCRFNHPTEFQVRSGPKLDCKYFKVGACKYGSICIFHHPKDRDGAKPLLFNAPRLPMPPVITPELRPSGSWRWFDMRSDRGQETESKSLLDKRVRSPEWRASVSKELATGFKRAREIPMNLTVNAQENLWEPRQWNVERQRREAQENLQEQAQRQRRDGQENLLEEGDDNIERQRRMAEENLLEQGDHNIERQRGIAEENLHQQRDNDIERQGRIAEENLQQQRLADMPENNNVDAQQNHEEQRLRNIQQERREARWRLDQIRPTVLFDEWSRPKELMKEFGFEDLEDPRLLSWKKSN